MQEFYKSANVLEGVGIAALVAGLGGLGGYLTNMETKRDFQGLTGERLESQPDRPIGVAHPIATGAATLGIWPAISGANYVSDTLTKMTPENRIRAHNTLRMSDALAMAAAGGGGRY